MKKKFIFAALTTVSVLASCQKESPVQEEVKHIEFTATISDPAASDPESKTVINTDKTSEYSGIVFWKAGDEIKISDNKGNNDVIYVAQEDGKKTWFQWKSGQPGCLAVGSGVTYSATFGTAPLPNVAQSYDTYNCADTTSRVRNIYMTTQTATSNTDLTFSVACGILRINATAAGQSVEHITVSDGTDTYVLVCEEPVDISSTKEFYIALPAGEYKRYVIRNTNGLEAVKKIKAGRTGTLVEDNTISVVSFSTLNFTTPVYPESETAGIDIDGTMWAPVNCGYDATDAPNGSFYQWRRRYGQNQTVVVEAVAGPVPFEEGNKIENKDKFFSGANKPVVKCSWYENSKADDNWEAEYDPCPYGWRVPTQDELNSLIANYFYDSTNKGYWFNGGSAASENNGVFFPISGRRDYSTGKYITPSESFYWSSKTNNTTYGYALHFAASIVPEFKSYPRCSGFSVRCIHN